MMTLYARQQKTRVRFLGQKDPLEKKMVTHSSILAWEIPWTEDPGGLQFMGRKESDTTERLNNTRMVNSCSREDRIWSPEQTLLSCHYDAGFCSFLTKESY